jgi:glycosyltransferase involved in cell wall biosynthesis
MTCGALTPEKGGGIATVVSNIVKHTYSKVEYTLASFYDSPQSSEILDLYPPSVEIRLMKANLENHVNTLFSKKNDFDIIHVNGLDRYSLLPVLARALKGCRISLTYSHHHGLEAFIKGAFRLSCAYALFDVASRGWGKVIANTQYCATTELGRFDHLKHKIVIIPNGVDINVVNKAPPIHLEGNPAILFLGHVSYIKGIDLLLRAFSSIAKDPFLEKAHLHIVGSGDMDKCCKAYIKRKGLLNKVHFWGPVTHANALRILQGSDIFVLPSRYENFPVVLLEAMAAGKPIIATNVGGIPEFVKDGVNGILVSLLEPEIAEALKCLIKDEEYQSTLGQNNRRDVRPFSWEQVAKEYVCLYESLLQ